MDLLTIVGITLVAAFFAALAQYQFKRNIGEFSIKKSHIIRLAKNQYILLGAFLYIISFLVYFIALRSAQLSFVYPTFASSFVFIALISKYVLKEEMSLTRIAGIGLVILGIIIIAFTY